LHRFRDLTRDTQTDGRRDERTVA